MDHLKHFQEKYPEKFLSPEKIFSHIHRGDRIFVGSACGAPQQLSHLLAQYIQNHPTAFLDAELLHVWTLGLNAFGDDRFHRNFRINSFEDSKKIGSYVARLIRDGDTPIKSSRSL